MRDYHLWQKIQSFSLDHAQSQFTFSKRLARDNKWDLNYSKRVIEEYKKFIYLCCVGYGQITPSDAVDQAWHLHLTYTKSYWIDLCEHTLKKQIHHNPTKGGDSERSKFSDCYNALLNAYQKEFSTLPPKDIWPDNETRFSDINFKRINLSNYWLIKKPSLKNSVVLITCLSFISLLFIQAENSSLGVFFVIGFIVVFMLISAFANKDKKSKKGKNTDHSSGGGFWWWGGSDGDSGCSADGCSSGCSGCGGCGS